MRLLFTLGLLATISFATSVSAVAQWSIQDDSPAQSRESPLIYERKRVTPEGGNRFFSSRRVDLIWFHSDTHTFRVIDNGPAGSPRYPDLATAMQKNDCLAGTNGGFFLRDHTPSGLMVAEGVATGRFGQGSLLSGVVLSSGNRNPYLLRRAEYGSRHRPTDLLQAGPFLVDQGKQVRGLSDENARRRTFVLHDGGEWFALGLADAVTLAQLGELLSMEAFSPSRRVFRALNLDGGSSSGFYVARGGRAEPIHVEPIKTVRNFLGIVPRATP